MTKFESRRGGLCHPTLGLRAALLFTGLALAACGETAGGGTGGDAGPTGGGETPTGGTGGAGGDVITGGSGGTGGVAPVGGEGGSGGTLAPDAAVVEPDAAVVEPDAAVVEPDAAVVEPDAAVVDVDGAVIETDAAVVEPDAAVGPAASACDPDRVVEFLGAAVQDGSAYLVDAVIDGEESTLAAECGGRGPEVVYHFVAPTAGMWQFSTVESAAGGFYDTVLYTRTDCADEASTTSCNDDGGGGGRGGSAVQLDLAEGEELFLVVDAFNAGASGTAGLRAETSSIVGAGEACDPGGFPRACSEGTLCLFGAEAGPVCEVVTPPTITGAEAFYNDATGLLTLVVDGLDPEDNASGLDVTLRDFAGNVLGPVFAQPVFTAEGGAFTASLVEQVPAGAVPFGASIVVRDDTGAASDAYAVEALTRVATVGRDAACDPDGLRSVCEGHDACLASAAGGSTCQPFDGVCDAAVVDLGAVMPDAAGVYAWDGDTTGAADVEDTSCRPNNGAGEQILRFTAPSAGTWTFAVDPGVGAMPMRDSLLEVRTSCAATGASLACNDDVAPGNLGSQGTATLAAGEVVILHVEGYGASTGTYRLTATAGVDLPMEASPTVAEADVVTVPSRDIFRIHTMGAAGVDEIAEIQLDAWAGEVQIVRGARAFIPAGEAPAGAMFELTSVTNGPLAELLAVSTYAEVRVRDLGGRLSDPVAAPIDVFVPPDLALGDECGGDPFVAGNCAPEDFCLDADQDPMTPTTCSDLVLECPAGYGEMPIDTAGDGPYIVQGDSSQGSADAVGARCEIGSGETVSVYTFTAPAAGMWRFATSDLMGGDSILSVRSACATPVPIGVLACNDDGAGNLASQADVELAAGQTVYVGVYGFAPGRDGPFTLTVSLRP